MKTRGELAVQFAREGYAPRDAARLAERAEELIRKGRDDAAACRLARQCMRRKRDVWVPEPKQGKR